MHRLLVVWNFLVVKYTIECFSSSCGQILWFYDSRIKLYIKFLKDCHKSLKFAWINNFIQQLVTFFLCVFNCSVEINVLLGLILTSINTLCCGNISWVWCTNNTGDTYQHTYPNNWDLFRKLQSKEKHNYQMHEDCRKLIKSFHNENITICGLNLNNKWKAK